MVNQETNFIFSYIIFSNTIKLGYIYTKEAKQNIKSKINYYFYVEIPRRSNSIIEDHTFHNYRLRKQ